MQPYTPRLNLPILAVLLAACAPDGRDIVDLKPPSSQGIVRTTSSIELPLDSEEVLLNVDLAAIELAADEGGNIYYTTNGTMPAPRGVETSTGGQSVSFSISRDTTVRWFAVDRSGNREVGDHEGHVRFDRVTPLVTVEPQPVGEEVFPDAIEVQIDADEPCTILYTLDGTLPRAGLPGTQVADTGTSVVLARTSTLQVVAEDAAGNRRIVQPLTYRIDTSAPDSFSVPPGGHFLVPIEVNLIADDPAAKIHFTTDLSEPTKTSPVWLGVLLVEDALTLKFRAIDAGGNEEIPRTESFSVGSAGPREPRDGAASERVDSMGLAALAAALLEQAGALSGRGTLGAGFDFDAWADARVALDALMNQSHAGIPGHFAASTSAQARDAGASVDANGNMTNLDEVLFARLQALSELAGATIPVGLFPLMVPFRAASSVFLRPLNVNRRPDGLPAYVDDYRTLLWDGASGGERVLSADSLGATLSALAARALTGTLSDHGVGDDVYSTEIGPLVGLRCGGCHSNGGVPPVFERAVDLEAALDLAGLPLSLIDRRDPGSSRLVALLGGTEAHYGSPITSEQRGAVIEWVTAGAPPPPSEDERAVGLDAREGLASVLAIEQAQWMLSLMGSRLGYDGSAAESGDLFANERAYVALEYRVAEGPAFAGLPRTPETFIVLDGLYDVGAQARILKGALAVLSLGQSRPTLFSSGPLSSQPGQPSAPDLARNLALHVVDQLVERTFAPADSTYRTRTTHDGRKDPFVVSASLADLITAFEAAAASGLGEAAALAARSDAAAAQLEAQFATQFGLYRGTFDVFAPQQVSQRPTLDTQMAILAAHHARARRGATGASDAATALEAAVERWLWDDLQGAWQTTFGERAYTYTPALAARVLTALGAAREASSSATPPNRLSRFHQTVISRGLRFSETWLTGESESGIDDDGDGVPKPQGVPVSNGIAPVFRREVRYE